MTPVKHPSADPLWYKDAVIYELHVKSFCDSNGDGVGDFRGLIGRLPYLRSLGVTALWLLPFYPSPLRDDGYDISDYYGINPDYGDMGDFRDFLREAHSLGLRVITELVVNHTSDQHPWFQRARKAKPGSAARGYYVWSDTEEKYRDARIIFKDFETSNWTWDDEAGAYYWHRFYRHQPDLNFENPAVQRELLKVVDFWLGMGVDGLRLDAVPYLYEAEGTNCENLPQTHAFLKKLRAHVDSRHRNKMLLCEANQWPEDAAAYFGSGDECNMSFHFPVMPRLFMSLWMEDSFPITDILEQTPAIPANCQWAVFLRNHDELTLEMVTDEERDYMYKVYARDAKARINLGIRRRLAPLLGNNRRKIELMNMLLLSLPGTPVLYYGDEIGMGDNFYLGDRNGVRTPMQWSPDRNAGFSRANPQKLFLPAVTDPEYHYEAVNVESQEGNLSSLLWWMRRVIAMRENYKAFGRGSLEPVQSDNPKVLAFVRRHGDEIILFAANLSRFSQAASLDLSRYAGYVPTEVFSGSDFPAITDKPYLFTPGVHNCYWFLLRRPDQAGEASGEKPLPALELPDLEWKDFFEAVGPRGLEQALAAYVKRCRCFGSRGSSPRRLRVTEAFPLPSGSRLVLVEAVHAQGWTETYALPLAFAAGEKGEEAAKKYPQALVASLELAGGKGYLYDAGHDPAFHSDLLSLFSSGRRARSGGSVLRAAPSPAFRASPLAEGQPPESRVLRSGPNGTTVAYGSSCVLRLCRRAEEGLSPDVEAGRLFAGGGFSGAPDYYGSLSLERGGKFYGTLGFLRSFVPNQGDAFALMAEEAARYYEAVQSRPAGAGAPPPPAESFCPGPAEPPPDFVNLSGGFCLEMAELIGRRTGEMHAALAAAQEPDFAPEPFSRLYQRSVFQSMAGQSKKAFLSLSRRLREMPAESREEVSFVLENQQKLLKAMQRLNEKKFACRKIRIHGNYQLSQLLYTGKDFVIKDFEGHPDKTPGERRIKRSPLRDAAGALLSLYYAAHAPFLQTGGVPLRDLAALAPWLDLWYSHMSAAFLEGYLAAAGPAQVLPQNPDDFRLLLKLFLMKRAVTELDGDAAARPDWARVPARLLRLLMRPEQQECSPITEARP
ncbi:MAG: maltose alpha-D-glucosyltransferase [Elusimicrobiales bacterium]|nr:maltose alpha-D-glucosyltransferase [Elusimicrobiales bacterium]